MQEEMQAIGDAEFAAGAEKKNAEMKTSLEELEEEEEVDEEEEEEEKKQKRKKKKKAKKGKAGPNLDLLREAGIGGGASAGYGYMNDYFSGASKAGNPKLALLMGGGFTHLNTIEEEKHETQTSNYFRDAAGNGNAVITESEREYDNTTQHNMRGSKILDEDMINSSHNSKGMSPGHNNNEFDFVNRGSLH